MWCCLFLNFTQFVIFGKFINFELGNVRSERVNQSDVSTQFRRWNRILKKHYNLQSGIISTSSWTCLDFDDSLRVSIGFVGPFSSLSELECTENIFCVFTADENALLLNFVLISVEWASKQGELICLVSLNKHFTKDLLLKNRSSISQKKERNVRLIMTVPFVNYKYLQSCLTPLGLVSNHKFSFCVSIHLLQT